jgi:soluble lytic murein transglycosylase-like protein
MNQAVSQESARENIPNDPRKRLFQSPRVHLLLLVNSAMVLMAASAPSILADPQVYASMNASGAVSPLNGPTDVAVQIMPRTARQSVSRVELERAVLRAARKHQLHPALLLAVMKAESSFNPVVVSRAGAVGLMQLIPETAMRHGVQNLYDTDENIAGGAKHLRYLLDRFHGNTRLALAAYNAGERKVDRYGNIPPYKETRLYVKKVLGYYRDYRKEGWVAPLDSIRHPGYMVRALQKTLTMGRRSNGG